MFSSDSVPQIFMNKEWSVNYLQNYSIKAKNDIILERFSIKECTKDFISRFLPMFSPDSVCQIFMNKEWYMNYS